MNEFLGLAYYAEVPGGDVRHPARRPLHRHADAHPAVRHHAVRLRLARRHAAVCLYPANPEECFYMAVQAFDLAERLQTPVLVLSDLDIGMNDWMCRDLKWDDGYRPDRGKMLTAEELAELEKFYRYVDKDGDGIAYRTLPGRASEGRLLHARLGAHAVRRLHRGLGRVPGRARPADAQVRDRRAARAASP